MSKKTIAITIGDINGISPEIILRAHKEISSFCIPLYFTNCDMLQKAAKLLNLKIPRDIEIEYISGDFKIKPGKISKKSGDYSYRSFKKAINFTKNGITEALVTMPIHKKAWQKANIPFKGHTDALRKYFKKDAIMMLGTPKLFVALYTEHIPLRDVAKEIKKKRLKNFLLTLAKDISANNIGVLALNPHAGDLGVLGDEEEIIKQAIKKANKKLNQKKFIGPLVPDIAFTPKMREKFNTYVAIYHDQGLAPLKALCFEEAINVSLNLPIIRTSVDHGTAFDIAYKPVKKSLKSYINAVHYAIDAS
jgi:4-hydroxythreonine-4-phosphate dehydrogenase